MGGFREGNILVFLCLGLIYGTMCLFSLLRVRRIHKFSSKWMHTKVFYSIVLLQTLLRCLSFLLLMGMSPSFEMSYLLLSIPDSLFLISYLFLIWQEFSVFNYSHEVYDLSMPFLGRAKRPYKSGIVIGSTLGIWVVLQVALYILFLSETISPDALSLEIQIANIIVPSSSLVMIVFNHISRSGLIYKSHVWKTRLRRVSGVCVCWSVSRVARGIVDIQFGDSSIAAIEILQEEEISLIYAGAWILVLIVSEVICTFLVLDYAFIAIFLFSEEDNINNSFITNLGSFEEEKETKYSALMSEDPFAHEDEIHIIEELESKQKLGTMYKGVFRNQLVAYRKIMFKRLSKYVIQEFYSEINSFKHLYMQNAVQVLGIVLDFPTVGIICPFFSTSLHNFLHFQQVNLGFEQELEMGLEIAKSIEELHSQGKTHGHLTSRNILLNEDFKPFICDVGFHKVKKYAAIMFGYSTKSGWSSPDILKEDRLIPLKVYKTDDVYSFGMILWEIITKQEPLEGFSYKSLKSKVVDEGLRPLIPMDLHPQIEALILACWNADSNSRPSFAQIRATIQSILH